MAEHINGYKPSASNPNKFMRGYGLFQYDLQFFLKDADFFLSKEWARFDGCMAKLLAELKDCLHKVGLQNKSSLTDLEMCAVAIAYNKGSHNPALGLKQGHKSDGKFYGESRGRRHGRARCRPTFLRCLVRSTASSSAPR